MDRYLFTLFFRQSVQAFFRHGEHASRAAGPVVAGVGGVLNAVDNGLEDEVGHQLHHIAGGEVFASLFVIFFVETTDQLLKHCTHAVIIQSGQAFATVVVQYGQRAQVDERRHEFFNDCSQNATF